MDDSVSSYLPAPDPVTPEWLTAVLHAAGALDEASRVTGFDAEAVGTGQVGGHRIVADDQLRRGQQRG